MFGKTFQTPSPENFPKKRLFSGNVKTIFLPSQKPRRILNKEKGKYKYETTNSKCERSIKNSINTELRGLGVRKN